MRRRRYHEDFQNSSRLKYPPEKVIGMHNEQPGSGEFFPMKGAADRAETAWKNGGDGGRLAENRVFRPARND
jgi:hypothetical protein